MQLNAAFRAGRRLRMHGVWSSSSNEKPRRDVPVAMHVADGGDDVAYQFPVD